MPSLKDTKRRIGSVKNTQKITRAMKLVASAKYTRANLNLLKAKPYWKGFLDLVQAALSSGDVRSPLTEAHREVKKCRLIVVAADRGLCGPLNSSLFKSVVRFLKDKTGEAEFSLDLWGKRAVMFGSSREEEIVSCYEKVLEKPNYSFAQKSFLSYAKAFKEGELDEVYVAYPSFQSALSQPPVIKRILPLTGLLPEPPEKNEKAQSCSDLIFEPTKEKMVTGLLEKFGAASLFHFLLEASTAENAARVAAMDSATSNADKVIKELTLEYNRGRQASITRELIEITSGAEAL